MAKIIILGAGLMGSAFSVPLSDNRHEVHLVGTHVDGDIIEQIHEDHSHPTLGLTLPDRVQPHPFDRLGEVIDQADLIVVGVNSQGIDWAAEQLGPILADDTPLLFLTKGLRGTGETLQILPEVWRGQLPPTRQHSVHLAAIGGPSIAVELAHRHHTSVVVTGQDQRLLTQLAHLLRRPYYHVWTNPDMVGVEVCVALKNVYALAVGLVTGFVETENPLEKAGQADPSRLDQDSRHNQAAAIFAQGLWEIAYLVDYMGGQVQSVFGLPGAGDLYVTSQGGRNTRMGRLLGLGWQYSQAKAQHMPNTTIEGADLAQAIGLTIERMVAAEKLAGSRIPLLRTMIRVVCHDEIAQIPWDDFFQGP